MAQTYKKMNIDINAKPTDIVTAVQKDAQSRYLDISLLDNGLALDLTGHEVRIYGKKPDGTEFYNDGVITNATTGRCQFELTSQALSAVGIVEVQVLLFKDNTQILSTHPFTINVVKSLMSDGAIESSNEYGALVVLYQNLYEAYDLMTEMIQKIGVPKAIAKSLGLNTMFEVWDWLIDYMRKNSSAGIVSKIDDIKAYTRVYTSPSKTGFITQRLLYNTNLLENSTYGLNALLSAIATKSVIKSIQRGRTSSTTIKIHNVNPDKCIVLLNNSLVGYAKGSSGSLSIEGAITINLTNTLLTIEANQKYDYSGGTNKYYVGWQVIEFY